MHLSCERDGGNYWQWEWTIVRVVIGKQEIRTDLALNNWGVGFVLHETDDWSIHLGPFDIELEYGKLYDLDDELIGPADLRLFSKVRERSGNASVSTKRVIDYMTDDLDAFTRRWAALSIDDEIDMLYWQSQ
jgi:hypothetical protein